MIRIRRTSLLRAVAIATAMTAVGCSAPATSASKPPSEIEPPAGDGNPTAPTPQRLRLSVEEKRIEIELVDNPTTRGLVTRLPLTLEFEDFAGSEKIAYLPEPLETAGSPGSHPQAGDLALFYRPWGNLALFYADFTGFSDDLIPLGTVVSGHQYIDHLDSGPVQLDTTG